MSKSKLIALSITDFQIQLTLFLKCKTFLIFTLEFSVIRRLYCCGSGLDSRSHVDDDLYLVLL